jgi:hypothetical protein
LSEDDLDQSGRHSGVRDRRGRHRNRPHPGEPGPNDRHRS